MASLSYYEGAVPGKKRKLTDEEKKKKQKDYEKKRKERSFNDQWKKGRSWLIFDKEKNKMFCSECKEYYVNDRMQEKSNSFIKGSDNFRASTVEDHSCSKAHMKAHNVFTHKGKSLEEKMMSEAGKTLSKLQESERSRLKLLFRNAHAVAKHNRPLTDYNWLCEIDSSKDLDIGSTYLNDRAAASFLHSIAECERDATRKLLTDCPFISFMMDGSTDIAGDEQETVYIRTCFKGNVTEKFLDISSPKSTKSADLYEHLIEVLKKNQINTDKLVAMGSDGASNMVGTRSGLSTLLKNNINSEIVNVHCLCHRLELAFRDVIKPIKLYDKLMTLLIGLFYFYKKSHKNKQGLKQAIKAMKKGVFPPKVTGTRWLPHLLRAILALLRTFNALEAHLSTASHENAKAGGLLKLLLDKQLMVFILFLKDALEPAMRLSLQLQKPRILLGDSLFWVESTIELLNDKKQRTIDVVQQVINTGEYSCISLKGPAPSLAYADKILEGFCNAIKERFQTETQNVLNATKILNFCGWPDPGSSDMKGYGNDEVRLVYNQFQQTLQRAQPNISLERIMDEWSLLKQIVSRKYTMKGLTWLSVFKENDGINSIMLLVDLMLTIPSTSVSCETAFSQLKLLKTCRRSRLGPSVLNNLMMVKLQSPDISTFQPDRAIDHWMTSSARKLTYKRTKKSVPECSEPTRAPSSPVTISDEDEESSSIVETASGKEPELGALHTLSSDSEENPEELEVEEPSLQSSSYVSMEDELEVLCDKDSNDDEDCYDFQSEMFNADLLVSFLRE